MKKLIVISLLSVGIFLLQSNGTNLINNGGFELGTSGNFDGTSSWFNWGGGGGQVAERKARHQAPIG